MSEASGAATAAAIARSDAAVPASSADGATSAAGAGAAGAAGAPSTIVGMDPNAKPGCRRATSSGGSAAASRARSTSSTRFDRRSHAMAFSHAIESTGVHGSGV